VSDVCLGIPGRVVRRWDDRGTLLAVVDFGGATTHVCRDLLPDARVGEYVIVHAGFALTRLDEASALASLAAFRELGMLEDELGVVLPPTRPAGGAGEGA
jgi:hydrogenase expression/formation protein HypC